MINYNQRSSRGPTPTRPGSWRRFGDWNIDIDPRANFANFTANGRVCAELKNKPSPAALAAVSASNSAWRRTQVDKRRVGQIDDQVLASRKRAFYVIEEIGSGNDWNSPFQIDATIVWVAFNEMDERRISVCMMLTCVPSTAVARWPHRLSSPRKQRLYVTTPSRSDKNSPMSTTTRTLTLHPATPGACCASPRPEAECENIADKVGITNAPRPNASSPT